MENQSYVESVKRTSIVQSFFAQVYGWMFFGLLSTGIVAYYTAHSPALHCRQFFLCIRRSPLQRLLG